MKAKVIHIYEKEEAIARSLGMTVKAFRDRKAMLLRQAEELTREKKGAAKQSSPSG